MKYTTENILKGIKENNNVVLDYIYDEFLPIVKYMVRRNYGTDEDARDLFQEAIIVIYRKLKKESLELNCTFKTYIYSVCKFIWFTELRRKQTKKNEISIGPSGDNFMDNTLEDYRETERYRLYQKHFQLLMPDCKRVLYLFIEKIPFKEIAELMGYKDEQSAKAKKYKCKLTLIENIKNDANYSNV